MDDIFVIKCAALSDGERVLLSILDKYVPGEKAGKLNTIKPEFVNSVPPADITCRDIERPFPTANPLNMCSFVLANSGMGLFQDCHDLWQVEVARMK